MSKDKMTLKQRKLLKGITGGLPVSQAAREAGYSPKSGKVYEMLERPAFKSALTALMDSQGLDDTRLLSALSEGLNATKTNARGEEIPDHTIRLKSLELAFRIRGSFAPERKVTGSFDLAEILKAANKGQDND